MYWARKQTRHSVRLRNDSADARWRRDWLGRASRALFILIVATIVVLSGILLEALAAEGAPDSTFGGGSGQITTDFGGSNDEAHALALQPDGRIVVVGETNSDGEPNHTRSALARYTRDGLPDTSFGNGGIVITGLQPANKAYGVAVQPDGKILTAGVGLADLTRYNPDGSLDNSFGNGGYTGTVIRTYAMALLPDGKILVAGYLDVTYRNRDFAVARYNSNGTLDTSFGNGGKATTDFLGGHDWVHAIAVQPDGKIVAAGQADCCGSYYYFAVARFNQNGTIDTSFGNQGRVWTNLSEGHGFPYNRAYAVAVGRDGRVLAAGATSNYDDSDSFAIVRYNQDGSFDSTFGNNGRVITKIFGHTASASALALQRDGKFFVAGSSNGSFALERFNRDGSPDTNFGSYHNGQVITQVFSNSGASAMALQPDGNVVLAGTGYLSTNDFALARFQAKNSNPAAFDFNGDGKADAAVFCPSSGTWLMMSSNFSSTRQWGVSSDKPVAGDFDGDGKTDIAVYRPAEGNWYILQSSTNTPLIKNWGASTDILVPGDYDGDGRTDVAVYRPSEGNWYIKNSGDGTVTLRGLGESTDKPVPADYDGDGRADIAIYRPRDGNWYIIQSGDGSLRLQPWGISTDQPAPADYDGDGRADVAVFRPDEGNWYIRAWTGAVTVRNWGAGSLNDLLVPADYDGDGRADIAVFRPSEGNWYIINSSTDTAGLTSLGSGDDLPVPDAYLRQ